MIEMNFGIKDIQNLRKFQVKLSDTCTKDIFDVTQELNFLKRMLI